MTKYTVDAGRKDHLILSREIIAVCSENHAEHISTAWVAFFK